MGEFPASLPPSPTEDQTFFTVRRVGSCTEALHQLEAGDKFAVRGPYGNGFPMEEYYGKNLVFVAGGIGLIPLRSLHRVCAQTPRKIRQLSNLLRLQNPAGVDVCPQSAGVGEGGRSGVPP